MKIGIRMGFLGAVALVFSGAAAAQQQEIGYPKGSLGVEAILNADFAAAERQLDDFRVSKDDPGRLINLGFVFMNTGRAQDAAKHFEQVLEQDNVDLIVADGRTMYSHDIARRALGQLRVGQ